MYASHAYIRVFLPFFMRSETDTVLDEGTLQKTKEHTEESKESLSFLDTKIIAAVWISLVLKKMQPFCAHPAEHAHAVCGAADLSMAQHMVHVQLFPVLLICSSEGEVLTLGDPNVKKTCARKN